MESIRQAYITEYCILPFTLPYPLISHGMYDFHRILQGKEAENDTVYRWVIPCLGALSWIFSVRFIIGGWQMLFNSHSNLGFIYIAHYINLIY